MLAGGNWADAPVQACGMTGEGSTESALAAVVIVLAGAGLRALRAAGRTAVGQLLDPREGGLLQVGLKRFAGSELQVHLLDAVRVDLGFGGCAPGGSQRDAEAPPVAQLDAFAGQQVA